MNRFLNRKCLAVIACISIFLAGVVAKHHVAGQISAIKAASPDVQLNLNAQLQSAITELMPVIGAIGSLFFGFVHKFSEASADERSEKIKGFSSSIAALNRTAEILDGESDPVLYAPVRDSMRAKWIKIFDDRFPVQPS